MTRKHFACACAVALGCGPPSASPPAVPSPSALRFAVVGDTRPPSEDDTASYPSDVIATIWQSIAAETPPVAFAVSTGDYMFASVAGREQRAQLDRYVAARAAFAGPQYAALGNHECTVATRSNCGAGNVDGITSNYAAFVDVLLAQLGLDRPYYVVHVAPPDGGFTAKLVVIACNAWDDAQASWLDGALAEATTYTFVVRHEPTSALADTPCAASAAIVAAHPLTLLVVGHSHLYRRARAREIVVGNGGAPLTAGTGYGYAIVSREPGGRLDVVAKDYATRAVIDELSLDP